VWGGEEFKNSRIQGFKKNKFSARISNRSILEFSDSRILEFFLVPPEKGEEEGKKRQSVDASLTLRG
jgi:hypothetical protein